MKIEKKLGRKQPELNQKLLSAQLAASKCENEMINSIRLLEWQALVHGWPRCSGCSRSRGRVSQLSRCVRCRKKKRVYKIDTNPTVSQY